MPSSLTTASRIVTVLDGQGFIWYHTPLIEHLLGFGMEKFIGRRLTELLHPMSKEAAHDMLVRMTQQDQRYALWRFRFQRADGGTCWLEGKATNFLVDPRLRGIVVYWNELGK